jgi:Flp pilus assembly pilin Flp
MLNTFWADEAGLASVEYALLLAFIVVVAITAWSTLGESVNTVISDVGSDLFGN